MKPLHPWAKGSFELLSHAEGHLINGDDFDRRIALISFDNAIEVAITTYLTLNPLYRGGRSYAKVDVEGWLTNYHSKLDFFDTELTRRSLTWQVERDHITWCHEHRNEQYHGGRKGTPEMDVLHLIREAALWIFATLYEVADVEQRLSEESLRSSVPPSSQKEQRYDEAIDSAYDLIIIGEQIYTASEVLSAVDHEVYRELGAALCETAEDEAREERSA